MRDMKLINFDLFCDEVFEASDNDIETLLDVVIAHHHHFMGRTSTYQLLSRKNNIPNPTPSIVTRFWTLFITDEYFYNLLIEFIATEIIDREDDKLHENIEKGKR